MNNFRVFSYVTATKKKENEPSRSNDNAHTLDKRTTESRFSLSLSRVKFTHLLETKKEL